MKLNKKITIGAIVAACMMLTPLVANKAQAVSQKGKLQLKSDTVVFINNRKGQPLTKYRGKTAEAKSGKTFKYYGKPRIIGKHAYYYIGYKGYINGDDVGKLDGQPVLNVAHNSYIYGKNGKRLRKYRGSRRNTFVYKGTALKYRGKVAKLSNNKNKDYYYYLDDKKSQKMWLPYKVIKGKQYYYLGAGGYIKAANISRINGKYLYARSANIKLNKRSWENKRYVPIYNEKGKKTSKSIKGGSWVKVDYTVSTDLPEQDNDFGFDYFHIKGKKDEYIEAYDVDIMPIQNLVDKTIKGMYAFPVI